MLTTKSVTPAVIMKSNSSHSAHHLTLINSFLPRTIVEWNILPPDVATSGIVLAFKKAINDSD